MREIGASGTNALNIARAQKEPTALQVRAARQAERTQLADDAIAAAGGDYMKAGQILATNRPGDAVRVGMTDADLQAAAQRFSERKAVQAGADRQTRENIADRRASAGSNLDKLNAMLETKGMPPINLGSTPSAAPAGDPYAQQRADWDLAAASARAQGKDPQAILGPRPTGAPASKPITAAEYETLRKQGYSAGQIIRSGYAVDDPTALSDPEAWEFYVAIGVSPDQATAKVRGRKR
jgi:hypothetical protein